MMVFRIETDGRWIAEIADLPGVLAYGTSRGEATQRVQALALRVVPIASNTERLMLLPTSPLSQRERLVVNPRGLS